VCRRTRLPVPAPARLINGLPAVRGRHPASEPAQPAIDPHARRREGADVAAATQGEGEIKNARRVTRGGERRGEVAPLPLADTGDLQPGERGFE